MMTQAEINIVRRATVISRVIFVYGRPVHKKRFRWTERNRPTLYNGLYLFRRGRL